MPNNTENHFPITPQNEASDDQELNRQREIVEYLEVALEDLDEMHQIAEEPFNSFPRKILPNYVAYAPAQREIRTLVANGLENPGEFQIIEQSGEKFLVVPTHEGYIHIYLDNSKKDENGAGPSASIISYFVYKREGILVTTVVTQVGTGSRKNIMKTVYSVLDDEKRIKDKRIFEKETVY